MMGFVGFTGRLVIVATIVVATLTQPAQAESIGDTTSLPVSPLLVTAYQTGSGGTNLTLLEIYNNSPILVKLQDWKLLDLSNGDASGSKRWREFQSSYDGYLEPGHHVVVAPNGSTSAATFRMTNWRQDVAVPQAITSLRLVNNAYRSIDAGLSTKVADRDMLMVRSYNTTSYSTAASPFIQSYRMSPEFGAGTELFDDGLYAAPAAQALQIAEVYPYASDCDPFDTSILCGDYVKLYNPTGAVMELDGLVLRTDSSSTSRTSSNTFTLSGQLGAGEYLAVRLNDTGARMSLTNSGGYVWLEDTYGLVSQYPGTLTSYESAGTTLQGYAYAIDNDGIWQWTSTPQPLSANSINPPVEAPCADGKYRNPETNRCRTLEDALNSLTTCDEGSERNPLTNRCRKLGASAVSSSLTPCKEGQVRNVETNRCRSIASEVADLVPCNEGYERNPATNRCRKGLVGEVKGVQYPVEPISQAAGNTAGLWTLGGIVAVASLYGVWEWRQEIAGMVQMLWSRLIWWRK